MTHRWLGLLLSGLIGLTVGGCPQAPVTSPSPLDAAGNATFAGAQLLPVQDTDGLTFSGEISDEDDIDVFNVGPLAGGDRLVIDVRATNGELDPTLALFNASEEIVAFNDDREQDPLDLDPLLDLTLLGDAQDYFIAIAPFQGAPTTGEYDVVVEIFRGQGQSTAGNQIVFLDWDGGVFESASFGRVDVRPFDATQVGLLADRTQEFKDRVEEIVADRYSGFNITVLNSDDHDVPPAPFSSVFIGSDSNVAFGVANNLDVLNAVKDDDAIVFAGAFDGTFSRRPTFEQLATAVGNTAAHEIGHLLGLVHTDDCRDIMEATCFNDALLVENIFSRAPLDPLTFPIGFQDATELLGWILGLELQVTQASAASEVEAVP